MTLRKPSIAVFAGPTATVLNSSPLVTSNQTRRRHGLPLLQDEYGEQLRYDLLRPQRLAKAVTVYVEQFSAHPLESEAGALYAPPDGYVDGRGEFHKERQSDDDTPVYEVELKPEDGLFPLPYPARRADGSAWDGLCTRPDGDPSECRQGFYPDASRVFEEIDRLGVDADGVGNLLGSKGTFDFFRVLPSGGYRLGRQAAQRTDHGPGDIAPEELGRDYFPYQPRHHHREPPLQALAQLTNEVQSVLAGGSYLGALWLEGSPYVEETVYWLNLLVDTDIPIVGVASLDWPHGNLGAGGDRNLVEAVRYLRSAVWQDEAARDRVGAVVIDAEQIFTARDVQKADARPGGFTSTGGHGGVVGSLGQPGPPVLTSVPAWRHTYRSDVRVTKLPETVNGVNGPIEGPTAVPVTIRDDAGGIHASSVPSVSIVKHARYPASSAPEEKDSEVEVLARIRRNLETSPLAGFVLEGGAPYGSAAPSMDAALGVATFSGMPVVRVGRGNAEGFVAHERVPLGIAGGNLTSTKARLLLMACLMKFGALPPARDPLNPMQSEIAATKESLRPFQSVFDTH